MTDSIEQENGTAVAADRAPSEAMLDRQVEAVLMSVDRAIPAAKIAEILGLDGAKPVNEAVKRLNAFYEKHERSFGIVQLAGGFQILTLPQYHECLTALHRTREENKLSSAALETLAIIAYKQPIMRTEIETIRGVACGEMVRVLMEKHLVKIVGRAEELGRPMLYGTTKAFLEVFGLASLKDLPNSKELQKP